MHIFWKKFKNELPTTKNTHSLSKIRVDGLTLHFDIVITEFAKRERFIRMMYNRWHKIFPFLYSLKVVEKLNKCDGKLNKYNGICSKLKREILIVFHLPVDRLAYVMRHEVAHNIQFMFYDSLTPEQAHGDVFKLLMFLLSMMERIYVRFPWVLCLWVFFMNIYVFFKNVCGNTLLDNLRFLKKRFYCGDQYVYDRCVVARRCELCGQYPIRLYQLKTGVVSYFCDTPFCDGPNSSSVKEWDHRQGETESFLLKYGYNRFGGVCQTKGMIG